MGAVPSSVINRGSVLFVHRRNARVNIEHTPVRHNLSKSDKAGKVQEVQTVLDFTITPFATSDEALKA
jgi:hypothetical protein